MSSTGYGFPDHQRVILAVWPPTPYEGLFLARILPYP